MSKGVLYVGCCMILLAGISEQEEHNHSHDEVKASPSAKSHVSRSLQATPEKHRDTSRDRDTTNTPRRRRANRRSLSLPTGSLSYGDVKISYRDGHFVTEPISGSGEGGGTDAAEGKRERVQYERQRSDTAAVLRGSLMDINSQEEMREEIMSLLERGFSTDDITLLFSQYLDQNSNHLGSGADSATTSSTQSLNTAGLYSTLPRHRRRNRDAANRPVSVDEVKLWQQFSQSQQSLVSEGGDSTDGGRNRSDSFSEAMEASIVPGGVDDDTNSVRGEDMRLTRQNSEGRMSDKSRSHRPGFIQRMLQKRKSFSDRPTSRKEDLSAVVRKEARDTVAKKVSIKGIFRRKSSSSSLEMKQDSGEPSSPPIATFMNDDDIGAVNSVPGSPLNVTQARRICSDSQIVPHASSSSANLDELDSTSYPALRAEPRGRTSTGSRVSERYSGEYSVCDFDLAASEYRSSEDTLTPRSTSPSNASTLTLEGEAHHLNRTLEGDTTLTASPGSLDRTPGSSNQPRPVRKSSLSKQEYEKLAAIVRGEITSSNSNDSGIQHDVTVGSSSESLKIPPEIASQLTSSVKLRNSPSPKQERPKSDFTVRWADLLEQVKETNVTYRREGNKLRKRPRPKSDLAEDSCEDEGLDVDSTSSEEGGSSLLSEGSMRPLGGAGPLGAGLGVGTLTAGMALQQYDSILSLVELRRPGNRGRLDTAALQAAKLAKSRRMSTPQPIKTRTEKVQPKSRKQVSLVRSHSMPENLDRLHRKKNYFSLIGSDMQSIYSHHSGGDDSSDESDFSVDYQNEKSLSTRASRVTLATLDQMMIEEENLTYAEALWDHVTMDPDELGFRAGDLIRVTDTADKHWWFGTTEHRDGWFPATFVRLRVNQDDLEAEMTLRIQEEEEEVQLQQLQQHQPSLPSHTNKTQLRANVVNEIISAETEYVKHLRDVIEGYLKQAKKRPEMFPIEKVTVIFSNIEEIFDFATKLLSELQASVNKEQPHLTEFGQCFLNKTQQFEIYSEYCNNHPAACEELREMYRVKRYRHFFEACRLLQEMTEIPLEGFLLTPVQKICKYHLQLAELLKYTAPEHPDYPHVQAAVDAMKKIAKLVNERKRKMESIEKLASWQLLVDDWEGPDILEDSSELIYSGELNKINANGWSQERYFFLFDHQLVYCKKDLLKKNSFGYKGRIIMDNSTVISISDGRDPQYNVTVRNAFKIHDKQRDKWFLMVAKTSQIKQHFNIPFHLKQTVITNLKQKSNLNKSKVVTDMIRTSSIYTLSCSSPSFRQYRRRLKSKNDDTRIVAYSLSLKLAHRPTTRPTAAELPACEGRRLLPAVPQVPP
ncbi:hypothetical protein BaRGS_00009491 [Batillaria attramentaria]|uniref:Uncharacterized protein n=1 Tax=Batillaria attramentaria TaxID=370345 RepID=A0ABD0LJ61_9CAEN